MQRKRDDEHAIIEWCARQHLASLPAHLTMQDLIQEGYVVLASLKNYSASRGKFSTYFVSALRNHYRRMRAHNRYKRRNVTLVPLEDVPEVRLPRGDGGLARAELRLDLVSCKLRVSPDAARLIDVVLNTESRAMSAYKEITLGAVGRVLRMDSRRLKRAVCEVWTALERGQGWGQSRSRGAES